MKILPDDFAIQLLSQVKEAVAQMTGAILDAIGQNIAMSWVGFWDAVFANEWNAIFSFGLTLLGALVFGYRFVRSNTLSSIEHVFSK